MSHLTQSFFIIILSENGGHNRRTVNARRLINGRVLLRNHEGFFGGKDDFTKFFSPFVPANTVGKTHSESACAHLFFEVNDRFYALRQKRKHLFGKRTVGFHIFTKQNADRMCSRSVQLVCSTHRFLYDASVRHDNGIGGVFHFCVRPYGGDCEFQSIPIEAVEDVLGYEEIPEEMMRTGNYFGLVVRGDSMEPKFSEGDTVIVKYQNSASSGDYVVALIEGNESTIKRIEFMDDGIILQPLNPAYKAMYFSKKDVRELPVNIIGKVVELRARF